MHLSLLILSLILLIVSKKCKKAILFFCFFEKDGLDAYWVEVALKIDPTKYHCFCPCIEDGFIPR